VDPRAGLDDVERRKILTLPGLELRPLGRPTRSQSLYQLRYHGFSSTDPLYRNIFPILNIKNVHFFCIRSSLFYRNQCRTGPQFSLVIA
jgi:hypothetical protein